MKNWSREGAVLIFVGLFFGIGLADALAQKPGGYSDVSTKDKEIVKASQFAIEEAGKRSGRPTRMCEF